ncbi:MAG: hypothetical protein ACI8W3_003588, partial [Myxococcota bacterium]
FAGRSAVMRYRAGCIGDFFSSLLLRIHTL